MLNATINSAPTPTKNSSVEREPEMNQTKRGSQWHVSMKMHIGVNATYGEFYTVTTSAANAHDLTQTAHLLDGHEDTVQGDTGYQCASKRDEPKDTGLEWDVATR